MENDKNSDRLPLLDIRAIWSTLRIRARSIILVFALVGVCAAVLYFTAEPIYSAEARVGLERQVEDVVTIEQENQLTTDTYTVDTEVQVVHSLTVAEQVVDNLNLAERPGFGFEPGEPRLEPEAARARAVAVLRGNLWVRREGLSYAMSVGFDWHDAQTSAEIVNAVVAAYIAGQESGQNAQTDQEVEILASRLDQLRDQVIDAEAAVSEYRDRTGLVDIYEDEQGAHGQLSSLNQRLAEARSAEAMAQSRLADARRSAIPQSYSSSVLSGLRARRAELAATEASLSERYRPGIQELADVQAEAAALDRQIAQEEQRIRNGLAAEARAAQSQVNALQQSIGSVESTLGEANRSSVRLAELERNAEAARVLYSALLERYRQAVASQGTGRGHAYVISRAQVPTAPSSPNPMVYLLVALVAAIIGSAIVVLVQEMLERGVRTRRGLETALGLPVVASTPDLESVSGAQGMGETPRAASDYALANSTSVLGEAMRGIRTHLKLGQAAQTVRSLAVTSAIQGEGKTTTALTLARTSARAGYRVVLVDCDERQRASSRNFPEGKAGLGDVLNGNASLEDALITDPETGLLVLPQVASSALDHDLFATNVMKQHIEALSQSFDLVVLDTPPVLPTAGAKAIAGMADATLFVVRWRSTPVAAAQIAIDQLTRAGARVEGTVLSFVDVRTQAKAAYAEEAYHYQVYESAPAT